MDLTMPQETVYSLEEGDRGAHVFALQKGINAFLENPVPIDGVFGPKTAKGVRRYQRNKGLYVDGIFGPASSAKLAKNLVRDTEEERKNPHGLVRSLIEGESGNLIGAVNWSVPKGVDVSFVQRRIYEGSYGVEQTVKKAWNPILQVDKTARGNRKRYKVYRERSAVYTDEWAWRLATLHHNYPYAADKISRLGEAGLSYYWKAEQSWVVNIGATFDDGAPVKTPLEWCQFYSLGSIHHDHHGLMVKYVTSWIT
jgi:hypothetical protein